MEPDAPEDLEILEDDNPQSAKITKLKKALEICQKEKEEYLNGWKRAKADYINAEREFDRRVSDGRSHAERRILNDLLALLDSFDEALKVPSQDSGFKEGIRRMYEQLEGIMKEYSVEVIESMGQAFDPHFHEAVELTPTQNPAEAERVVSEVQKGYLYHGEVLRPAKVKVGVYQQTSN